MSPNARPLLQTPGAPSHVDACSQCVPRARSICRVFDHSQLARLNGAVERRELERDEVLFSEGNRAESIYVVTHGCLKLYRGLANGGKEIVGFLFPGDALGLVLGSKHYGYTAEAVTDTAVCTFHQDHLDQLIREFPEVEGRLLGAIWDGFTLLQDQVQLRGRKSALERVASFLETVREQQDVRGAAREEIDLPMSPADIADFLDLSFEAMNAAFSALKCKRVIDFVLYDKLAVKDSVKLAQFAGMESPSPKETRDAAEVLG